MRKISCIVLGLVIAAGGRGVIRAEATTPTSAPATQGGVRIELTSPMEWEVFQRGNNGTGVVRVAGKVEGPGSQGAKVALFLGRENEFAQAKPNIVGVFTTADASGAFSFDLAKPSGGWFTLMVDTTVGKGFSETTVKHVGVGEVFVVGGQSNSTNYGEVKTTSETGMVTVFDGEKWTAAADPLPGVDGKGGSPWCLFGDDLVGKLHVPIGIVPVGRGSTSVRQWLPKGDAVEIEPSRTFGLKKNAEGTWESEGALFDRMVERMKELGPKGFRAMLWHQGESDAHQSGGHTLPGKDYRVMLERVIKESRKEVGWEVPWFVATATWGSPATPADPDIRAAQEGVVTDGAAMAGPDTDTLIGENRQKNGTGVHMSAVGLKAHAGLWAEIVGKWVEGVDGK